MKQIAYWWLMFWVQAIGYAIAGYFGIFQMTWYADISRICFFIIFLHIAGTIWIGYQTIKQARHGGCNLTGGWYLSELVLSLGMLGTVIGFIYMITVSIGGMSSGELSTENLRAMITALATGIGTALWTTLWGLVASISLKTQMNNLESAIGDER
jgi:hypothetical protein